MTHTDNPQQQSIRCQTGELKHTAPFSLLLPVYVGNTVPQLQAALESCLLTQTLLPAEVVIVQDGQVAPELQNLLAKWQNTSPVPLRVIKLSHNQGLAAALNRGLAECSYEIVARMDADDICFPTRFAAQWELFNAQNLDLLGAGMSEFIHSTDQVIIKRVPPVGLQRICEHAVTHSPFNHPTVMYKKSVVLELGGYTPMGSMEDYWLFVRLLAAGVNANNIPEPLVYYRADSGVYRRRGGLKNALTELKMQRAMLEISFITPAQFVRNCVMKTVYRLLPARVKKVLFAKFIAGGLPGDKK